MTAPGDGFKMADAYIDVHARDKTRTERDKLEAKLRELQKHALLNFQAKDDTRAEIAKLEAKLRGLKGDSQLVLKARDDTRAEIAKLQQKLRDLAAAGRLILQAKNDTRAEIAKVNADLRGLHAAARIPLTATDQTTPELNALRSKLRELQRASRITPTYASERVLTEMGTYRTRYYKVSHDSGTFIGEVMGRRAVAQFSRRVRHPYLFAPILAGAVALMSSAAILAIPTGFALIAGKILQGNTQVAGSFHRLGRDVKAALGADTGVLADNFVRSADRIGAAFQGLRPQMRGIFDALNPQIDRATTGVIAFATNAMPGLLTAVRSADEVVDGLADGMAEAGTGVTRFFNAITTAAPQAGQSLRTIGVISGDVLELLGRLGAGITKVFGGQIWNEAEGLFDSLTQIVGDFAERALPALGVGLEIAMTMFGGLLNIIEPFAGIIGTWVGSLLGAAIVIRSVSGTLGVLAAMFALLKGNIATAALTLLARQFGAAGVAASAFTTRLTGSVAAGEKVAAGTNKLVSGLQKVGNTLPVIGMLLVGASLAYDQMRSKADELAKSVVTGSMTMRDAIAAETAQVSARQKFWGTDAALLDQVTGGQHAHAEATAKVTAAVQAQLEKMGPLERARAEVTLAEQRYQEVLKTQPATSEAARAAAMALSLAHEQLARAEHEAERAGKQLTQAVIDQTNAMRSAVDAEFAYEESVKAVAEAQKAASQAIKDHGRDSQEARDSIDVLARAMNDQAEAARRSTEAANAHEPALIRDARAAEAYVIELLRLATASDQSRAAFVQIAEGMNTADLEMISAKAAASGLRTEILNLPGGRTVTVVAETDVGKLNQLKDDFRNLKDITIGIDANITEATTKKDQLLASVNSSTGLVNIDGNPIPAGTALQTVLAQIAAGRGEVIIDGKPVNAQTALQNIIAQINAGHGMVTVNGQTMPAAAALQGFIAIANGSAGTAQIFADPAAAQGTLGAFLQQAGTSTATSTIAANAFPAVGVLNSLLGQVNTARGTMTQDANPSPAQQKLNEVKQLGDSIRSMMTEDATNAPARQKIAEVTAFGNAARATLTQLANPAPARGTIVGVTAFGNQQRPTMTVNAREGNARSVIDNLKAYAARAVSFFVNAVRGNAAGGIMTPMARGGVLAPMARGGVVDGGRRVMGFADGGTPRLRPMSGDRATVVPANTWRVIGDNLTHPELYAPLDGSRRSLDFIAMGAATFGHALVKISELGGRDGGVGRALTQVLGQVLAAVTQARARTSTRGSPAPPARGIPEGLLRQVLATKHHAGRGRGDTDQRALEVIEQVLARVLTQLPNAGSGVDQRVLQAIEAALARARAVQVTTNVYNPAPERTSAAVAARMRTLGELGVFS